MTDALPIPRTLGAVLAGRRRVLGLTQREVAERAGISAQYLNDIEHDRRSPRIDATLLALAAALDHEPAYLFLLAGWWPPEVAQAIRFATPESCDVALAAFRAALAPEATDTTEAAGAALALRPGLIEEARASARLDGDTHTVGEEGADGEEDDHGQG